MRTSDGARRIWLILLAASGLLLVFAGCRHGGTPQNQTITSSDPAFVGNEACKPCHKSEFDQHHLGRHDTSLRAAECSELGQYLPALGVIPLAGYSLERNGDTLCVARMSTNSNTQQTQYIDLVLGSGKLGMTYVSIINDDSLMETRMSYFPPYKLWDLTPGQEVHLATDVPFGREHPNSVSKTCIGCHSTTLPLKGIRPDRKFFGIGCEACHGPGKPHIDAVRAGQLNDVHMENLGQRTPTQLNELCGKCHRTANNVDLDSPEVNLTHRFQPYALLRSSCRTAGNEQLSCLYCHDAHKDVSADTSKYEAVCLTCHAGPGKGSNSQSPVTGVDARRAKVCPVNALNGCIGCHMRPKTAFPLTSVPAKMADHLISPPGADRARVVPRIDPGRNSL